MSFGSRLLIWGWMVMVTMWWVDGAALQSTMNPPTMQRNNSEPHRNSSIPENLNMNVENSTPVMQPFGINPNARQFPMPPPGMMMPGFRPMPPPGMLGPNQQPQFMSVPQQPMPIPQQSMQPQQPMPVPQQPMQSPPPKREVTVNATAIPGVKLNMTNQNNNTRRDTEQSVTTFKPQVVVTATHKSFTEPPLGNDPKQPEGTKLKDQPQLGAIPPQHFNPMMQMPVATPFGSPFVNPPRQQVVMDAFGNIFVLVPLNSPFQIPQPMNMQSQLGPQGPPLQVPVRGPVMVPFGQPPPPGAVPLMPDNNNKQPQPVRVADMKNKNATSTN